MFRSLLLFTLVFPISFVFAQGTQPILVAPGLSCSEPRLLAWGENANLNEDRLIYTRREAFIYGPSFQPETQVQVYDFNYQQEYPVNVPNSFTYMYRDDSVGISKDWIYWVRAFPTQSEIHLLNIFPPYQHVILDSAQHVTGGTRALESLTGGNEFDPIDRNDFILSWIKLTTSGTSYTETLHWCRVSDCLTANIQTGLPSYLSSSSPGTLPGESILQAIMSITGGSGPSLPGIIYQVKKTIPNVSYSWEAVQWSTPTTLAPSVGGPDIPISGMRWNGLFNGYMHDIPNTSRTAVSIRLPQVPSPTPALFTSNPPPELSDKELSISKASSMEGAVMFAYTRGHDSIVISPTPVPEVRVGFLVGGVPTPEIILQAPPPAWAEWMECAEPSVFGNRVVVICRHPDYRRELPLLFESICHP